MTTRSKFSLALITSAITATILCVAPVGFSQRSDERQAKLLTSYSHSGPSCELGAALDLLAETLRTQVDDVAYVIVYGGYDNPQSFFHRYDPPGLFRRHALAVRNYLVRAKDVESRRFEVIDGGMRKRFQADIWLVARGQKPPSHSPDATSEIPESSQPRLFDEYGLYSESDMAEYFDPVSRLDGFAKGLAGQPGAVGYIIGYAQCLDVSEGRLVKKNGVDEFVTRDYKECDAVGTGRKIGTMEKRSLIRLFGTAPSRMLVVDGGYRDSQMVELWIVPANEKAPKPTPTTGRK